MQTGHKIAVVSSESNEDSIQAAYQAIQVLSVRLNKWGSNSLVLCYACIWQEMEDAHKRKLQEKKEEREEKKRRENEKVPTYT
jgi:hypothetical protein